MKTKHINKTKNIDYCLVNNSNIKSFVTILISFLAIISNQVTAEQAPTNFTSLGNLSTSSGTLVFNTDSLQVTSSDTGLSLISNIGSLQAQGTGFSDIAVFTFSDINIASGVTIQAIGSRPLALLSKNNVSIFSSLDISGLNGLSGGIGLNGTNGVIGRQGDDDNESRPGAGGSAGFGGTGGTLGLGGLGGVGGSNGMNGTLGSFGSNGGNGGSGGTDTRNGLRGSNGANSGGNGGAGGITDTTGSNGRNGQSGNFGGSGLTGVSGNLAAVIDQNGIKSGASGSNGTGGAGGKGGGGGGGGGGQSGLFVNDGAGSGGGGGGGSGGGGGGAGGAGAGGVIEIGAIGNIILGGQINATGGSGGSGGFAGNNGVGGLGSSYRGDTRIEVGAGGNGGNGGSGGNGGNGGNGAGGAILVHGANVSLDETIDLSGSVDGIINVQGTLQFDIQGSQVGEYDIFDIVGNFAVNEVFFNLITDDLSQSLDTTLTADKFFTNINSDFTLLAATRFTARSDIKTYDVFLGPAGDFSLVETVPIPNTILLFGSALFGLAGIRGRK